MTHRMIASGQIFLFLLLIPMHIPAVMGQGVTLYRCEVDGAIEFRQTACERGDESLQHVIDSSSGMTPSEPGVRLKKPSEKSDTVSLKKNKKASDKACWKRRQQLERVERRLRAGYKASEYQRLHERQREYEDYVRRFCR